VSERVRPEIPAADGSDAGRSRDDVPGSRAETRASGQRCEMTTYNAEPQSSQHSFFKRSLRGLCGSALIVVTGLSLSLNAQQPTIEAIPVRGHVFLIGGAGSNITVSAGPDGVFLVDSGTAANAEKVIAAIKALQTRLQMSVPAAPRSGAETTVATNLEPFYRTLTPPKPIRYIANTSALPDHTGGNDKIALAGKTFTGGNVTGEIGGEGEKAAILSHENVLARLGDAKMPAAGLPTDTYFGKTLKLAYFFNGEGVELLSMPGAVTDGDSVVHFRGSDIIATGE